MKNNQVWWWRQHHFGGLWDGIQWDLASTQATEEQEKGTEAIFTVQKEGPFSFAFWSVWLLCGVDGVEAGHCPTFVGAYWAPAAMQTTEEEKLAEGQSAVW